MMTLTDTQLIALATRGNASAFIELARRAVERTIVVAL